MTTKTTIISCMLAALLFNAFIATAQKSSKKFSFGFGLEGGIVAGDFKDVYNAAAGITLRGSYKVGPGVATLTTGGIGYLPKSFEGEDLKAGIQIPVKAGYKYVIKDHFFVMGEVGFSSFRYYFEDFNGGVAHSSQSGFTYAPSIGFQTGKLELGLRYESTSFTGSTLSAAMLRLGFNF